MKDRIKALLEDKSEQNTIKNILFKMWDDGMDYGDVAVLGALGFDTVLARDRKTIQGYLIDYISDKIGSKDFTKIRKYWLDKIIETLPKSFTFDNGFWNIVFVVKYPHIEKDFYGTYMLSCSIYLSDKSYYRLPDGGVKYISELEDSWENENFVIEMEEELTNIVYDYTLNHYCLGVNELAVEDFIESEKILKEERDEDDDPLMYYIEGINDGDEDIIESINDTFGGVANFLKLLIRQHRFSEIDFMSRDLEKCSRYNMVLLGLLELNTPESFNILETIVGMGDIVEENGVYYWWSDREDWTEIFRDSRDGMSKKIIGEMLSSEFDSWNYWDSSYHRKPWEIYEELTPENAFKVKSAMKKVLLGKSMETDENEMTPVLQNILKLQKSEDIITLNNFALDMIMNDDDSFESLFKNNSLDEELDSTIFIPLKQVYDRAEESAFWDECYKKIYSKIENSGYADNFTKGTFQQKPYRRGDQYKFDITKNLKEVLGKWLNEYKNYSDDIKYYGSYIGLIQSLGEFSYETVWPPQYPDWRDTVKLLNSDYINDEF